MMAVSQIGLGENFELLRAAIAEVDPRFMPAGKAAEIASQYGREEIVRTFKTPQQISQQNIKDVLLRVISALRNDERGGLAWRRLMSAFGMPITEDKMLGMTFHRPSTHAKEEKEEKEDRAERAWVKAHAPKPVPPVVILTQAEQKFYDCVCNYIACTEEANRVANRDTARILAEHGWTIDPRLQKLIVDVPADPVEHEQQIEEVLSKYEFTPDELTHHLDNYKYEPSTTPQYYAQSPGHHAVQASAREKVAQRANHLWQHLRESFVARHEAEHHDDPEYAQFMKEGFDRHVRSFAIAAACQGIKDIHAPIPGAAKATTLAETVLDVCENARKKELDIGYKERKHFRATVGESFSESNLPEVREAFTMLMEAVTAPKREEKSAPSSRMSNQMRM